MVYRPCPRHKDSAKNRSLPELPAGDGGLNFRSPAPAASTPPSASLRQLTDWLGEGALAWVGSASVSTWPLLRQIAGRDRLGLGAAATSDRTRRMEPRTRTADKVVASVCPYCGVGCGQLVYVHDGRVTQIEGDPASPISRGRLCPKGSATKELVTRPARLTKIRYRRPHGTRWEELDLDAAMEMIADRVIAARGAGWEDTDAQGRRLRRT